MSSTPEERRTTGHDEYPHQGTRSVDPAIGSQATVVREQPVATTARTEPVEQHRHRRTTDLMHASLGLFLLRLVTAGILGIHGYQHLDNHNGFKAFLTSLNLPSPEWMAWGVGIAEVLAAVALVFGLLTRLTGLCVCALMAGILVRVLWQHGISIHSHDSGFKGELELLLGTVGLMFALLGGGRWGIDGAFRAGRARNRDER